MLWQSNESSGPTENLNEKHLRDSGQFRLASYPLDLCLIERRQSNWAAMADFRRQVAGTPH